MTEPEETVDKPSTPLPAAPSEEETTEKPLWPQMDDGSPTLSTDTNPGDRPGVPAR